MSIVDLAKARAHADSLSDPEDGHASADWIRELADEVESLQRALLQERQRCIALAADLSATQDEHEEMHAGLEQLYHQVARLIAGTPREDES